MPSLLQCLLILALISLVLGTPTPQKPQKRSFKVELVPTQKFAKRADGFKRAPGAGTRALVKAYRKYGVALPPGLKDAMDKADAAKKQREGNGANGANGAGKAGKADTVSNAQNTTSDSAISVGTVTATPEAEDVEYLAPISVGGQVMNMDFDTGSSDLWVFNTQLSTSEQTGHTIFNPANSSSFKVLSGQTFSISYGDGSGAAGTVGTDTVNIGGATVTSQAVELATTVSSSFITDTQSNGLVGLAFSKLNTVTPTQQKTFFANAQDSLPEPVFTADLRKDAVGAYEFGAIDSTKFNGSLAWTAINTTTGFWQFTSTKFAVNGGDSQAITGASQAIADTGTTLMLADASVINGYYSTVEGAVNNETVGGVTVPCSATLPDLQVQVGSAMATVRGDDINYAPVDEGGSTCFGGLQAIDSDLMIYGDIFFNSNFVAFNGGNNSIGVASHV